MKKNVTPLPPPFLMYGELLQIQHKVAPLAIIYVEEFTDHTFPSTLVTKLQSLSSKSEVADGQTLNQF